MNDRTKAAERLADHFIPQVSTESRRDALVSQYASLDKNHSGFNVASEAIIREMRKLGIESQLAQLNASANQQFTSQQRAIRAEQRYKLVSDLVAIRESTPVAPSGSPQLVTTEALERADMLARITAMNAMTPEGLSPEQKASRAIEREGLLAKIHNISAQSPNGYHSPIPPKAA